MKKIIRSFIEKHMFTNCSHYLFRKRDPAHYDGMGTLLTELVSTVPDCHVLPDLDYTAHFAVTQGGDLRRLAMTGLC